MYLIHKKYIFNVFFYCNLLLGRVIQSEFIFIYLFIIFKLRRWSQSVL